jgi:Rrf2 family protein
MIISQTAQHALRAILYVARRRGELVRVHDAAAALEIPRNYLSKILHRLARAAVLSSTRGKAGGFRLAIPAQQLTLWAVVREFDDMPEQRYCLLGRRACNERTACAVHDSWKQTAGLINAFFSQTTIAHLLETVGADSRI